MCTLFLLFNEIRLNTYLLSKRNAWFSFNQHRWNIESGNKTTDLTTVHTVGLKTAKNKCMVYSFFALLQFHLAEIKSESISIFLTRKNMTALGAHGWSWW